MRAITRKLLLEVIDKALLAAVLGSAGIWLSYVSIERQQQSEYIQDITRRRLDVIGEAWDRYYGVLTKTKALADLFRMRPDTPVASTEDYRKWLEPRIGPYLDEFNAAASNLDSYVKANRSLLGEDNAEQLRESYLHLYNLVGAEASHDMASIQKLVQQVDSSRRDVFDALAILRRPESVK